MVSLLVVMVVQWDVGWWELSDNKDSAPGCGDALYFGWWCGAGMVGLSPWLVVCCTLTGGTVL
jgi:hypothetical protein